MRSCRLSLIASALLWLAAFNSSKAQDIGVSSLIVPYDTICGSTNWPIVVSLTNYDAAPIDFSLNNVTFTATISGASSQTFSFVLNTGTLAGYGNQNVTITNLADMSIGGTHIFNVTATAVTDINHSNDGMPAKNVLVKPSPNVYGEPNPSICAGTIMPAFTYTSDQPGATFTWTNDQPSIGLAPSGTGSRPAFTAINAGSVPIVANITVSATLNGCMGSSLGYLIQVNPLPTVNAGADQTGCTGSDVYLSNSGSTGTSYYWIFGDGNTSSFSNPVHAFPYSGIFDVSLSVTDASGCYNNDTVSVTIIDPPAFSVVSADVSCNGLCNGNATISGVTGAYPPFTYSWTNGVTTSNTTNLCAGYYVATVTNSVGCSFSDTLQINEPAAINPNVSTTPVTCYGTCSGTASVTPTGGIASYTYYWSPGSLTSATATGLCAGMYTVSVTDANGCIKSATAVITEPGPVVVTTSPNDTICLTTSTTIYGTVSGGTPPYLYSWNNGATTASTVVNPSASTMYVLNVSDANSCVGPPQNVTVTVAPNTNITGQVTYSGGALSSGVNKAVLFKQQSVLVSFDTVQINTLDASGIYNFSNVNQGDYLVKVFPDTSVYHNMVPTYYGNHYLWDSAATVFHGCSVVNTANIVMIEGGSGSGPGEISGHITQGIGFGRAPGGPVPGIDIKLGRNPGGLYANTQTDSNGDYSFTGIPVNAPGQKYVVYVDIPGIGRDSSYTFTLSAGQNQFKSLDYYVDSAMVHPVYNTTVGINHEVVENNQFSVYPNPSKGNAVIEYSINSDSHVTLGIYNVLGVKISELVNEKQSAGLYTVNVNEKNMNIHSGIYFIELVSNGKKTLQKIIISE